MSAKGKGAEQVLPYDFLHLSPNMEGPQPGDVADRLNVDLITPEDMQSPLEEWQTCFIRKDGRVNSMADYKSSKLLNGGVVEHGGGIDPTWWCNQSPNIKLALG